MAKRSTLLRLSARLAVMFPIAALLFALPALAAGGTPTPSLGSAGSFAVLAGTAVTCTDSTVNGDVGEFPGTTVTRTSCVVHGTIHAGDGVAQQAQSDFQSAYSAFGALTCTSTVTGTLAGKTLTPGIYCIDSTAKTGLLTLDAQGNANAVFIFKVTPSATGALTGTNFSVVMANGGSACNVYWWVPTAATMTTSNFLGTILAGTSITVTGGTFDGRALAKVAVTLTGVTLTGCVAGSHGNGNDKDKEHCNQGVGNGPEGCDPGNSNQGDPSRSNDELGGTPGDPGRQGGNGKH
jgi:Ice-binding-like